MTIDFDPDKLDYPLAVTNYQSIICLCLICVLRIVAIGQMCVGMMVTADNLMNFSALHYTPLDLGKANHPYELTRRKKTILTVDMQHCGLGGGSCCPGPMGKYQMKTEKATFSFSIRPYHGNMGNMEDVSKMNSAIKKK